MRKLLASLLLCGIAVAASAQWAPPVPPALALATAPGLSGEQQAGVRKILLQHRDALDALATKERAELEALQQRSRAERERADDATDANLRKLLGDEGYRKFAEWQLEQHGPRGMGPGAGGPHGPGHLRPGVHDAPPPPNGGAPIAENDND